MPRYIASSPDINPLSFSESVSVFYADRLYPDVGRLALAETSSQAGIEGTVSIIEPNGFELTMTDELHDAVKHKFSSVREGFTELVQAIKENPFGDTNIDEFKDTDAGQMARLVHRVEGPLADLIPGKKLAVKTTGLDMHATREYLEYGGPRRSSLTSQFRETLALGRTQKTVAPAGIGGCIFVNEVFGVLKYWDGNGQKVEWILMERVDQASSVRNTTRLLSNGGRDMTFQREEEPALAAIADPYGLRGEDISFRYLKEEIQKELGLYDFRDGPLADLNGNNILKQQTPAGNRYTLIDVASANTER